MVTIVDYKKVNSEEKEFFSLILEGDIEFVTSTVTGKLYATSKRCSISSTFSEEMCKRQIGRTLPGSIEKVASEPYDYQIPGSDEVVTLSHSYVYNPNVSSIEDAVFVNEQVK